MHLKRGYPRFGCIKQLNLLVVHGLGFVGLGQSADGLGWIGSHRMDRWMSLVATRRCPFRDDATATDMLPGIAYSAPASSARRNQPSYHPLPLSLCDNIHYSLR